MVNIFLSWFTTIFCVCECVRDIYMCVAVLCTCECMQTHTHMNKKCRPDVKVEGHFLFIFIFFNILIYFVSWGKQVCATCIYGQMSTCGNWFPSYTTWGLGSHSDPKAWWQVPCPAESSCQPSYSLETGSCTEHGLHRPSGQHTPEINPLVSVSLMLGIQAYCLSRFLWGFGDWVLVLRLAGQASTSRVKSSLIPSLIRCTSCCGR